ncbi:MAG TPA: hypothetical protein PLD23_00065 [Armatimonadota bacterium]|nr:hypothetical protein [Armatimonadota bacterium]HQK91867.1 hypothetical protein [Armatimonadota bacterium]
MRHGAWITVSVVVAVAVGLAAAQDNGYALKDYMPRAVGSIWSMQPAGGGQRTTLEVLPPEDINGHQVSALVTKSPDGTVRMGTYETVDADSYIVYGSLFVAGPGGPGGGPQGPAPDEPRKVLHDPPARFPGTLKVGETYEATFSSTGGRRPAQVTMKITLEAVESVTVPKGTFDGCLKVVTSTTRGQREMKRTTWYAKGVGPVKTERVGRNGLANVTELVEYKLGETP